MSDAQDYIMVSPSGRAFLLLDEMPEADRKYFHIYRSLAPEQQAEARAFAEYLARCVRKHPDCVARMCGRTDCGREGPCYVGPDFPRLTPGKALLVNANASVLRPREEAK